MPLKVLAGLDGFDWSDKRQLMIEDDCIVLNQANACAQAVDAASGESVVAAVWSRTVGSGGPALGCEAAVQSAERLGKLQTEEQVRNVKMKMTRSGKDWMKAVADYARALDARQTSKT